MEAIVNIPIKVDNEYEMTPKIKEMISEYANMLLRTLSKKKEDTEANENAHWADEFCGIWKDEGMSAEEIIEEIRNSRHVFDNRERM